MTTDEAVAVALAGELHARYGRSCSFGASPARLSGGFSSDLFEFTLSDPPAGLEGTLVLRLQPGRDAVLEHVVHAAVAAAGYGTPSPLLWDGANSAFERPYTIMRRLDGAPAVRLDGIGAVKALRHAPVLVADAMARLHDLDPQPALAELQARGITMEDLGADGILREIEAAAGATDAAHALEVLRRDAPDPSPPVILHGDLHALNLWREPDGSVAVLDWELATLGPPELDIARTALIFSMVPGEIPRVGRPVVMRLGARTARSFLQRYMQRRPIDAPSLSWYRALHALRVTTAVLTRPPGDAVATQWRPVAQDLAQEVEVVTGVRLTVPPLQR